MFPTLTPSPLPHPRHTHTVIFFLPGLMREQPGLVKPLQTGRHKVICVSAGGRSRRVGQLSVCVSQEASSLTCRHLPAGSPLWGRTAPRVIRLGMTRHGRRVSLSKFTFKRPVTKRSLRFLENKIIVPLLPIRLLCMCRCASAAAGCRVQIDLFCDIRTFSLYRRYCCNVIDPLVRCCVSVSANLLRSTESRLRWMFWLKFNVAVWKVAPQASSVLAAELEFFELFCVCVCVCVFEKLPPHFGLLPMV